MEMTRDTILRLLDELDWAADWLRTLRDFEEKRPVVKHVIERLGYEDLAYYV